MRSHPRHLTPEGKHRHKTRGVAVTAQSCWFRTTVAFSKMGQARTRPCLSAQLVVNRRRLASKHKGLLLPCDSDEAEENSEVSGTVYPDRKQAEARYRRWIQPPSGKLRIIKTEQVFVAEAVPAMIVAQRVSFSSNRFLTLGFLK